ncbi:MAG: hypothetical protein HC847_23510 [Hydrococcus sp. RU_2_2]|nr:hypothetical protein [Hydrococcus sp. RU_2_2]NJP21943.1 hypothetical protein [Hydrococcus sp. CRU_1_1]
MNKAITKFQLPLVVVAIALYGNAIMRSRVEDSYRFFYSLQGLLSNAGFNVF